MSDEHLKVFVNARGVDVAHGGTVMDALRAFDAIEAEAVAGGARRVMDSRGLPIDGTAPVWGGAILRTVPVRARAGADVEGA